MNQQSVNKSNYYHIYWHDDQHTVLISEVHPGWTWSNAQDGLEIVNNVLAEQSKISPVYSIIHFQPGAQLLPKTGSTLNNIRKLLREDPQNEKLTIYVIQNGFLQSMMQIVSKLYGIRNWIHNQLFVTSLDEAFAIIEQDKKRSDTTE